MDDKERKILFLVEDWVLQKGSPGGGTALALSHFELLRNISNRIEVGYFTYQKNRYSITPSELYAYMTTIFPSADRVFEINIDDGTIEGNPLSKTWKLLFVPTLFRYGHILKSSNIELIRRAII